MTTESDRPDGKGASPDLSALATKVFYAFRDLSRRYKPHPCGGFNTDDVQWMMGVDFCDLDEAIAELETAGLIKLAGYDEQADIESCYSLTEKGATL